MSYAKRADIGWVNCMSNGKYAVDVYVWYQLDEANRKIRVVADNQRLRSLSNRYWYNYSVNNGYQLLYGTNDSEYGRVYDPYDNVNCPAGGFWVSGVNCRAAVYSYNANGDLSMVILACQMIMSVPNYDPTYYGFIQNDWKNIDISDRLPKITKAVEAPEGLSVDSAHIGSTSAIVSWVGNSKAQKYLLSISGGNTTASAETVDCVYTVKNLTRNTKYTVSIIAVDASGNQSNSVSIDFTTRNQIQMYVNDNGSKKKGDVYIRADGSVYIQIV